MVATYNKLQRMLKITGQPVEETEKGRPLKTLVDVWDWAISTGELNVGCWWWWWLWWWLWFDTIFWAEKIVESTRQHAVAQWLRCCATIRKVNGSIPAGVSWSFIDIKSFRSHYGPGINSASNRNEYQVYFLGGKGGRSVRLTTLPLSCVVVT